MFDEEKQDWVPKWGYKGKNKELEQQWIVEVPANKGMFLLPPFPTGLFPHWDRSNLVAVD